MSTDKKPLPAEPHNHAVNEGVAVELTSEGHQNLVGFFDVLIQMDLAAKKRNERNGEHDNDLPSAPDIASQAD